MKASLSSRHLLAVALAALVACHGVPVQAAEVTFFSLSDTHFGADDGGKKPPTVQRKEVAVINSLPGTAYPSPLTGVVGIPKGVIMQGDLINDGAVAEKYPTQWQNYIADFGVNGEGRCRFPVFEGLGNHDANPNLYVFDKIKERNVIRKKLGFIGDISPNGYHYSWDWDGVHFVNVNLFPGNVWEGEADAYGRGHDPMFARDFLIDDLKKNVGDSGRPVVIVQHFRVVDENWWTFSAADKFHKAIQDYNVIAVLVGHQGGGVGNNWRGYDWISSNGSLVVFRINDNTFSAIEHPPTGWGKVMQKKIFYSYADSGLPAAVNNGDWASAQTSNSATLSGKIVYDAAAPTEATFYWGTSDGGDKSDSWQHSQKLGVHKAGVPFSAEITGLEPWTRYYYRTAANNSKGTVWAGASIPFDTNGTLPPAWQTTRLGHEQRPGGGANFKDGTFTVRGSGRDIAEPGEPIDNGQFAYQVLVGDGEIIARLATTEVTSREPKAGIMMRETLADGSKNVALMLIPRRGIRLSARTANDQASKSSLDAAVNAAPTWLKLLRHGQTFSGYVSEDGKTWKPVAKPVTVEMAPEIHVGLAVTAGNRDESKLHNSTFEQVSVSGESDH